MKRNMNQIKKIYLKQKVILIQIIIITKMIIWNIQQISQEMEKKKDKKSTRKNQHVIIVKL